jgi:hypothetical protein
MGIPEHQKVKKTNEQAAGKSSKLCLDSCLLYNKLKGKFSFPCSYSHRLTKLLTSFF